MKSGAHLRYLDDPLKSCVNVPAEELALGRSSTAVSYTPPPLACPPLQPYFIVCRGVMQMAISMKKVVIEYGLGKLVKK